VSRSVELQRSSPPFPHLPIQKCLPQWPARSKELNSKQFLHLSATQRLEAPGLKISSSRCDACRIVKDGSRQMKALPTEGRARVMPWRAASVKGLPKCPKGPGSFVPKAELTFSPPDGAVVTSKLRF